MATTTEVRFSQRELTILQMKANFMSHKEVGAQLGVSVSTVTRCLTKVYGRLRVSKIGQALDYVIGKGLIEPPKLLLEDVSLPALTAGQRELGQLFLANKTDAQIIAELGLTKGGLATRYARLYPRYGVRRDREALRKAVQEDAGAYA